MEKTTLIKTNHYNGGKTIHTVEKVEAGYKATIRNYFLPKTGYCRKIDFCHIYPTKRLALLSAGIIKN